MSAYNPYAVSSINEALSRSKRTEALNSQSRYYKVLISFVAIALIVTCFFLIRTTASTPFSNVPVEGESIVVVSSGDTLWSIASQHYSHLADKGFAVYLIKERNQLQSSVIMPGDKLILPVNP